MNNTRRLALRAALFAAAPSSPSTPRRGGEGGKGTRTQKCAVGTLNCAGTQYCAVRSLHNAVGKQCSVVLTLYSAGRSLCYSARTLHSAVPTRRSAARRLHSAIRTAVICSANAVLQPRPSERLRRRCPLGARPPRSHDMPQRRRHMPAQPLYNRDRSNFGRRSLTLVAPSIWALLLAMGAALPRP